MFLTVHAAVGALIGANAQNPYLAFGLGMTSHFVLDSIPHLDPHIDLDPDKKLELSRPFVMMFIYAAIDSFFVALLTLALLFYTNMPAISILPGIIGAILPDYLVGLNAVFKNPFLKKFHLFHDWCHFDNKKNPVTIYAGGLMQLIFLFMAAYFLWP